MRRERPRRNRLAARLDPSATAFCIASADLYSVHSLRRGFANWATSDGWDLKTLMEYVGWKDVHSAMRYVEAADPFARRRIESALPVALPDPNPA
ncbi:tyrosine-type recombinase/integrase [Cupriavidus necator]